MFTIADRTAPQITRLSNGLSVADWAGEGQPILALHGSSSTYQFWSKLASDFPSRRVIAPDLRGRGLSASVGGPYGMESHMSDLVRLIEELELRDVVLIGHSMGAFMAPLLARRASGLVSRMVLLDGGLRVQLPFFFIPPVGRLVVTLEARRTVRPVQDAKDVQRGPLAELMKEHPEEALVIAGWLDGSMLHVNGRRVAALDPACLPVDAVGCFFDPAVRAAAADLACPAHLLFANWGAKDGAPAFYKQQYARESESRIKGLTTTFVPGSNHVTLLFRDEVVSAVAG